MIGNIEGIPIKTYLTNQDKKIPLKLEDLPREIKKDFFNYKNNLEKKKKSLDLFLQPSPKFYQLDDEIYFNIINLKGTTLYNRCISNERFLSYLLQLCLLKELKEICRDFKITHYSNLNKQKIIDLIINSLSDEERFDLIREKEMPLISLSIAKALQLIKKPKKEKLINIEEKNPDLNEIEFTFKGISWEVKTFLIINQKNIDNPEWDCDCLIGSSNGFCEHFWVAFFYFVRNNLFPISKWHLTILPKNFKEMIKKLNFSFKNPNVSFDS